MIGRKYAKEAHSIVVNGNFVNMLAGCKSEFVGLIRISVLHIGLQSTFDADWKAGTITRDSYRNGTEDGALAYKLLIQTGSKKDPFNYSQVCGQLLKHEEILLNKFTAYKFVIYMFCFA